MRYLILTERDRERFGCPDKMPFDWASITNVELVKLKALGFGSLQDVARRLQAYAKEGLTEDTVVALNAVVWLALRRSGVHVDINDEFEYDLGLEWYDDDPDPEPIVKDDPGKAPESAASTRSSPRTGTPRSRTSRRK